VISPLYDYFLQLPFIINISGYYAAKIKPQLSHLVGIYTQVKMSISGH